MSDRIIQIFSQQKQKETIQGVGDKHDAIEQWSNEAEDNKLTYFILTDETNSQDIMDDLQSKLPMGDGKTRILVLPVEAHLPIEEKEDGEKDEKEKSKSNILREELQEQITRDTQLDRNYILLVCFSTIVAAIGLVEDNAAVLVGAMVIAPFLGPNLAQTFAAAMGEKKLFITALKTSLVGTAIAFTLGFAISFFFTLEDPSQELLARAQVDYSSIFLALASGSAAVLSLTRGISSILVGVMVAVALLPPLTASALFLGMGDWFNAANAFLLMCVNVVCINLSGLVTFAVRGIGPRSWWEKRKARNSVYYFSAFWCVLLFIITMIIVIKNNMDVNLPLKEVIEEQLD